MSNRWMYEAAKEILSTYGLDPNFQVNIVGMMREAQRRESGHVLSKCPSCGGPVSFIDNYGGYVTCISEGCHFCGPDKDPDAAKWEALCRRINLCRSLNEGA